MSWFTDKIDKFVDWLLPPAIKPPIIKPVTNASNRSAFLTLIATSEGTQGIGDRGYNCLFGGGIFESYADHPRKVFDVPRLGIKTTAAGRYQVLARTFDAYKLLLNLPDFSPPSQDRIALRLIFERNAMADVDNGKITDAMKKCSNIWASFQGNNYGQPKAPIEKLMAAYTNAGGIVA